MELTSIKIERFKRIREVDLDLKQITVLIGGNNSGKSSFLQGVHFAITTVQSSFLAGEGRFATTLGADQLVYKPADDPLKLNLGSPMSQSVGPRFTFGFTRAGDTEPNSARLSLYRGKNANISIGLDDTSPFFIRASDRKNPFSVFVPGLAGVALREERRADATLATGIAQGDSNLYLRNVLLRITEDASKLARFHDTISAVFPGLRVATNYDEYRHQYIPLTVTFNSNTLPLELAGTGCLQAIQLVAYATMYDPALLLLDEPDSHLHPSNQRLLADTLVAIAEKFGTKIILSTHSRHIFDALRSYEQCQFVWLKNGAKQPPSSDSDLSMLLDLGALDSYEMVAGGRKRVVVLTEDSKPARLEFLLKANGFRPGEFFIQPFHGVDNIQAALPVADFFSRLGNDTHILIHRDGDGMLTNEKEWVANRFSSQMPERTTLFITPLTDIEHQYCQIGHIAACYGLTEDQAGIILNAVLDDMRTVLTLEFANKRSEAKAKILRAMQPEPLSATDIAREGLPFELARGKTIFGHLLPALHTAGHNEARLTTTSSPALAIPALRAFAEQAWPAT